MKFFALLLAVLFSQTAHAADLPNVVFVMADDLGYGDPRCYNAESKVPTPNMDRLAREGMRFTDAHTPSAVCTPTRYGVVTGRYCWRTKLKSGVLLGYSPALIDTKRSTVASLMASKGYATGCVGKWHLGLGDGKRTDYSKPLLPGPNSYGFQEFFGIPASLDMVPYVYVRNDRPVTAPTARVPGSKMRRHGGGGFWRGGPVAPDFKHIDVLPRTGDEAVSFIEKHAKTPNPFFLYFPLSAPHTPWLPTEEYVGKSGAGPYGDFVVQVDDVLGRVLDALDRTKASDNTLIIFTSDNGSHWGANDIRLYGHRANRHLRGQKADIWEAGHRVPFIARWPGRVEAGSTSEQLLCLTDLYATLADLLGSSVPVDAAEDSFSFLPALLADKAKRAQRKSIVHHSLNGMFAVRRGEWKLVVGRGSGGFSRPSTIKPKAGEAKGQLFNLVKDPSESQNLWLEKPEKVKELMGHLNQIRNEGRSR